jgi:hypothetical protein
MTVWWFLAGFGLFGAGFALGVLVGITAQHRNLAREVVVQARDVKAWLDKWGMYVVGALLIVIALLTYQSQRDSSASRVVSGTALSEVQQQNTCMTTYANRLYESLTPRQQAAESLQGADNAFAQTLLRLLTKPSTNPDVNKKVLTRSVKHKIAVADHLSRERAANPYPPPPKVVCPK